MSSSTLLLVEDDPVSARFLADALATLAKVVVTASVQQARTAAQRQAFDLLLIDCNLPDGSGPDLLTSLRASPASLNGSCPAVALSAELDERQIARLRAQGFVEVLAKPLSTATLCSVVSRLLPVRVAPLWDDATAIRALGPRPEAIRALRELLLGDLERQRSLIERSFVEGQAEVWRAELHRLRAACGFCGAAALAAAVDALRDQASSAALTAFVDACHQLSAQPTAEASLEAADSSSPP